MRHVRVGLVTVISVLAIAFAYLTSGGLPVLVEGSGPDGQGTMLQAKPGWLAQLVAYHMINRPEFRERLETRYTRAACQERLSASFEGDQVTWPLNPPVTHNGSRHVLSAEVKQVVVDEVNSLTRTRHDHVRCVVEGSGNAFRDYSVRSMMQRTTGTRTAVLTP